MNLLPNTEFLSFCFDVYFLRSLYYASIIFLSPAPQVLTLHIIATLGYVVLGFGASVLGKRGSILGPGRTSSSLPLSPLPWRSGASGFMGQRTGARKKAGALALCKHPTLQYPREERGATSAADRADRVPGAT